MRHTRTAMYAGLTAVILTSSWQYYENDSRWKEVAQLQSENRQLREESEIRHRTHPVQSIDSQTEKKISIPNEESVSVPIANYRNEGQSSPLSALQTFAWACDQGDSALMEKLVIFDSDAREKAEKFFSGQPTALSTRFSSLEAMAAVMYISNGIKHPYPFADILRLASFESVGANRVVLHLPGANGDGYMFQHTDAGWKVAITNAVVEDYIKQSSARPAE